MKIFYAYIKERRKYIVLFVLFCLIFAISFFLYRLPVGAVVYPALLSLSLGSAFAAWDFLRFRIKHNKLTEIKKLKAQMIEVLPAAHTLDDEDYQEIIRGLQREISACNASAFDRYRKTVEYYTVWVHQIKTPITSMRLSLEGEDTPLSRKLSLNLSQIEQYVEMVLAYLRLDSDSSDYVFNRYALDGIIEQSITKFAADFIERKIKLNYIKTDRTVLTDDKWLSFVIEQLLSNALKYTRRGGEIKIYMDEPDKICIEDTGIGIAPNDLPRVFEKGYTGYNGRKDKRSSGIGLYLCRRICEKLGIGISITSELGKGTTATLDLREYDLLNPLK